MMSTEQRVQTGLERFLQEGLPSIAGARIGLMTNQTGVDRDFRSTIELLQASPHIQLAGLFGPEHGLRGDAQAGVAVDSAIDARTGLPIFSLYGATQRLTPAMLDGLKALVLDLQDIGVRYATYISTMADAQECCAHAGVQFVVLDRPNPITGLHIEGSCLDPNFGSFVGTHAVPVRHGLTIGEMARLLAGERGWPAPLVVSMLGWQRGQWYDQTGIPWVQPSPNLPTLDAVTLYSGTCLLEGTNLSEGRGTTRPFELVGAPWIDPPQLAAELQRLKLPGVAFRPTYFTPTFSKHAHVSCGGVQIYVTDRETAQPLTLGLYLLQTLRALSGERFTWIEGAAGGWFIDLLLGADGPRHTLNAGTPVEQMIVDWTREARVFEERRRPYLLYT